jgi:hypothetical protein
MDANKSLIERTKGIFEIGQSLFTTAAIICAGVWFLLQHQCGPKLQIEHRISQRPSASDPTKNLVGIDVVLSNIGNVGVTLLCGHLRVLDVNPGNSNLIWPTDMQDQGQVCLDTMTIEPNEGDQIHREILVGKGVKTVRVRTFFKNPKARDGIGWEFTSLYDFDGRESNAPVTVHTSPSQGKRNSSTEERRHE